MTTTYKKLASVFLTRGSSGPATGYYYGDSSSESMPIAYSPYKIDTNFGELAVGGNSYAADSEDNIFSIDRYDPLYKTDRRTGITTEISDPNATGTVRFLEIDSDQKFLVGGDFSSICGVARSYIARLNSDGSLDTSFDPNANNDVESIALQPDGKILIGGKFTSIGGVTRNSIARLNNDGSLDTSFDPNANNTVESIALQSDGKILIGGKFTSIGGVTRNYIARLNSDGTLDTNFKTTFFSPYSGYSSVSKVAVGPDDDIFIGAIGKDSNAVQSASVLKLDRFGNIDTSFVGPVMGYYAGYSNIANIHILEDKKVIFSGGWSTIATDGTQVDDFDAQNAKYDRGLINLIKLNSDGTVDLNFRSDKNDATFNFTSKSLLLSNGDIFVTDLTPATKGVIYKKVFDNTPNVLAYTAPLGTQAIVKNIFATNHNDFPVFHDIVILPDEDDQAAISERHYYVLDSLIYGNDYECIDAGITLSAGDQIYVYSSTDEDISYNIFGIEITE